MVNEIINGLGVLVPVVIVGAGGIGIVGSGYVKASPDKAYIISGLRKIQKFLLEKLGLRFHSLKRKTS